MAGLCSPPKPLQQLRDCIRGCPTASAAGAAGAGAPASGHTYLCTARGRVRGGCEQVQRYITKAVGLLAVRAPDLATTITAATAKAVRGPGRDAATDRPYRRRPALLPRQTQEARHERAGHRRSTREGVVGLAHPARRRARYQGRPNPRALSLQPVVAPTPVGSRVRMTFGLQRGGAPRWSAPRARSRCSPERVVLLRLLIAMGTVIETFRSQQPHPLPCGRQRRSPHRPVCISRPHGYRSPSDHRRANRPE